MTLDKTYADFEEALLAGKPMYQHFVDETATPPTEVYFSALSAIGSSEGSSPLLPYQVAVNVNNDVPVEFSSATKDGVLTQIMNH